MQVQGAVPEFYNVYINYKHLLQRRETKTSMLISNRHWIFRRIYFKSYGLCYLKNLEEIIIEILKKKKKDLSASSG